MVSGLVFDNARRLAREVTRRNGVVAPGHVNIEGFVSRVGFKIVEVRLRGASGQLVVPRGGQPHILLSTRVTDPAERRFIVAHEYGHYVMRHPSSAIVELHDPTQPDGLKLLLDSRIEAEADAFAIELLMPEPLVRPMRHGCVASLDPALRIAYTFGVTAPIAAIRFTQVTDAPCVIVLSERGVVRRAENHVAFPGRVALHRQVDERALAWDYFERGTLCPTVQRVPAAAWLDDGEGTLLEHSIASHERGTVLTLLTIPTPAAMALDWPGALQPDEHAHTRHVEPALATK
jgi:hypothetical protein